MSEISTPLNKPENYEIKKTFFEYWKNLDIVFLVNEKEFDKAFDNVIRQKVVTILGDGIDDEDPFTGEKRKRHVLAASELLKLVNKQLETIDEHPTKKANFYFHMQKLEDAGFIRVVDQIATGKLYTSYYGRTARVFLKEHFMERKHYRIQESPEFMELIRRKSNLTDDEIISYAKKINLLNDFDPTCFPRWIEENEQAVEGIDIDFRMLERLVSIIRRFSPSVGKALNDLAEIMEIKHLD
ncbi:MAG: hypothetical protein ACXAD7_13095 [Candidatus Kariarchaeaceae archaeon]|jgi:hypothetical protein